MENHRSERDARDASRKAAWETSARQDGFKRGIQSTGGAAGRSTLADRAKYQFEADSEDDDMENGEFDHPEPAVSCNTIT